MTNTRITDPGILERTYKTQHTHTNFLRTLSHDQHKNHRPRYTRENVQNTAHTLTSYVHCHMTNTRITDPEILERTYKTQHTHTH